MFLPNLLYNHTYIGSSLTVIKRNKEFMLTLLHNSHSKTLQNRQTKGYFYIGAKFKPYMFCNAWMHFI